LKKENTERKRVDGGQEKELRKMPESSEILAKVGMSTIT
jgi:hypothetical protein